MMLQFSIFRMSAAESRHVWLAPTQRTSYDYWYQKTDQSNLWRCIPGMKDRSVTPWLMSATDAITRLYYPLLLLLII